MMNAAIDSYPGSVQSTVRTTLLALVLCYCGRDLMPRSTDFLSSWTATRLLADGHRPYEPAGQARVQRELGWDKNLRGGGRYEFLPFYYPPWFALLCAPLGALAYPIAERAWFFINVECVLFSGILLG